MKKKNLKNHFFHGRTIVPPFPQNFDEIILGLGCFWGAERKFWTQYGVYTTAVGYAGGNISNPSYEEVCSGLTGHSEVVKVIYNPKKISLKEILKIFWESHNPTQGMRQGNDTGSQYRSVVYCNQVDQFNIALTSKDTYERLLAESGHPQITTEILCNKDFFYAEDQHQQYLAKNPNGYCGLKGTGVEFL